MKRIVLSEEELRLNVVIIEDGGNKLSIGICLVLGAFDRCKASTKITLCVTALVALVAISILGAPWK